MLLLEDKEFDGDIYLFEEKLFFSGDMQIIKWFGVDIESIDKTRLIQKEDLRIDESHPPVDVLYCKTLDKIKKYFTDEAWLVIKNSGIYIYIYMLFSYLL